MEGDVQENIILQNNRSKLTVNLFGATVTSWKPNGLEVLFVSKKSFFDNKRPIRGGIPIVFPQFGPWENGPQHGFARRMKWRLHSDFENTTITDEVTLVLEDNEETRAMWNHKFKIEYTLKLLIKELKMSISIVNTGESSFGFKFLLHNYFGVDYFQKCKIRGLQGCEYYDKVLKKNWDVQVKEVEIVGYTDKVFYNTQAVNIVTRAVRDYNIVIIKENLPDTVVWNPGYDTSQNMEDFGGAEWNSMLCVEAGYVHDDYTLAPGQTFDASQMFSLV